jgi:hypothetical protein
MSVVAIVPSTTYGLMPDAMINCAAQRRASAGAATFKIEKPHFSRKQTREKWGTRFY